MRAALSDRLLLSEALEVVGVMLRGYANGGRDAGASYQGALAETLMHYPRCIAAYAGDVKRGVPSTTGFLPTPAAIIAWAEKETDELRAIVVRDDHYAGIQRDMQQAAKDEATLTAARAKRPTYDDLKEKYGPTWGITDPTQKKPVQTRRQAQDALIAAIGQDAFDALPDSPPQQRATA